jgi:hypothetical protein
MKCPSSPWSTFKIKREFNMKAYKTHHPSMQVLLHARPGKGNPVPVRTEPDPDEPHHNPLKPKRKKRSEYDIVMQ